eukprot:TRINITY_DN12843_c0_g1_i1.p1 TRINITY_DN12843_c0_g1~~TRINITY_DN12843_c0_g1_i1.p1  ORF type:complete len:119 (+),score=7.34 TRINITY_DN12843_c0_g1_i1:300-656(+)
MLSITSDNQHCLCFPLGTILTHVKVNSGANTFNNQASYLRCLPDSRGPRIPRYPPMPKEVAFPINLIAPNNILFALVTLFSSLPFKGRSPNNSAHLTGSSIEECGGAHLALDHALQGR